MELNKKKEQIEKLNLSQLKNLIKDLTKKSGYTDITINSFIITANIQSGLTTDNHLFVLFDYSLSGRTKFEEPLENIIPIILDKRPSSIFIVSNSQISNKNEKYIINKLKSHKIDFWDVNTLITKVNSLNPDYWYNDNIELLEYEKNFLREIKSSNDLKNLNIFNDKHKDLLDFFIEPRLVRITEDRETSIPVRKDVNSKDLIEDPNNIILSGEAGAGKSTLLKNIGEKIININRENSKKKVIPILIYSSDLVAHNFNVNKIIESKLKPYFDVIPHNQNLLLLLDSIDEFDFKIQEKLLKRISQNDKWSFVLATRNQEKFSKINEIKDANNYFIISFNNEQVIKFITKFFGERNSKAQRLIDSLKDQRVLEKLPINPLTLSLISMLYEESNYEVPATITDIYDNFSSLLLGKISSSHRFKLIDVSYRERLLSIYALHVLNRRNHECLTKGELIDYFKNYYKDKESPLQEGKIEDLIEFLIENTGILHLSENDKVVFRHDSFLEYYAAVELFKHRRDLEDRLIDNFYNFNWQNTAIFYAGMSKDLPLFLEKINSKVDNARNIENLFSSILGMGYLLQSLYQTSDKLRSKSIDIALSKNIEAYELMSKLLSLNDRLEKFNIPMIMLINTFYFYENFNSITLKSPLEISFKKLLDSNNEIKSTDSVYKAIQLALTLGSKRIGNNSFMEMLVYDKSTTSHPVLTSFVYIALDMFENDNYQSYKNEINVAFEKQRLPINHLLKTPARKLRLTNYDIISSQNKIKILVEGIHDAKIIDHAYIILNNGSLPPWKISIAGNNEIGGAIEVSKTLMNSKPALNEDSLIIGIFDRDEKGVQEYNSLKTSVFDEIELNMFKKHKECNIYALCLPVPESRKSYLNKEQKNNYFEIEHYFSNDFLESVGALNHIHNTIDGEKIYNIKAKSKKKIVRKALSTYDKETFSDFQFLFDYLDAIIKKFNSNFDNK